MKEEFLTVKEVAKIIRKSARSTYRFISDGKLRTHRIGRAHRIRRDDLERFIENSRVENQPSSSRQKGKNHERTNLPHRVETRL